LSVWNGVSCRGKLTKPFHKIPCYILNWREPMCVVREFSKIK
jgi:hypothetical protein